MIRIRWIIRLLWIGLMVVLLMRGMISGAVFLGIGVIGGLALRFITDWYRDRVK